MASIFQYFFDSCRVFEPFFVLSDFRIVIPFLSVQIFVKHLTH